VATAALKSRAAAIYIMRGRPGPGIAFILI
jgi:hypothetical protein